LTCRVGKKKAKAAASHGIRLDDIAKKKKAQVLFLLSFLPSVFLTSRIERRGIETNNLKNKRIRYQIKGRGGVEERERRSEKEKETKQKKRKGAIMPCLNQRK
jgi:NOL1/NOP2/fmu family ribosome biogenesis protein